MAPMIAPGALTPAPRRVTPPWRQGEPGAPVFLLSPGTLDERTLFEAALAAPPWNAGRVQLWEQVEALRDASAAWMADDADARGAIDALLDQLVAGEALDEAQQALFDHVEALAVQHWPAMTALRLRGERRRVALPHLACRWFLRGWENVDAPFALGVDGHATDAALGALPADLRQWIGLTAYRGLYLDDAAGKPSAPPPSSCSGPATSPAGGDPSTAARDG